MIYFVLPLPGMMFKCFNLFYLLPGQMLYLIPLPGIVFKMLLLALSLAGICYVIFKGWGMIFVCVP